MPRATGRAEPAADSTAARRAADAADAADALARGASERRGSRDARPRDGVGGGDVDVEEVGASEGRGERSEGCGLRRRAKW